MSVTAAIAIGAQLIAAAPAAIKAVTSIVDAVQGRKEKKPASKSATPPGIMGSSAAPGAPPGLASRPTMGELPSAAALARFSGELPTFTESQQRSIAAISGVVQTLMPVWRDPGIAIGLIWALVANAWVESRLRPGARNPVGEDSRGLFQVNLRAHPKLSDVDLYNPKVNTAAILQMILKDKRVLDGLLSGCASVAQLTWDICYHVERPRNRAVKAARRADMVKGWLGQWATVPIAQLDDLLMQQGQRRGRR